MSLYQDRTKFIYLVLLSNNRNVTLNIHVFPSPKRKHVARINKNESKNSDERYFS